MGFRVEGVTEASLTSDVCVACLFQHSWRVLAGLSPLAFSEGVRKLQDRNQGRGGGGERGRREVKGQKMLAAAYCGSLKCGARPEFHAGWSGWTRPPTMGGGGGRNARSAKQE